jgi:hypothetical protein
MQSWYKINESTAYTVHRPVNRIQSITAPEFLEPWQVPIGNYTEFATLLKHFLLLWRRLFRPQMFLETASSRPTKTTKQRIFGQNRSKNRQTTASYGCYFPCKFYLSSSSIVWARWPQTLRPGSSGQQPHHIFDTISIKYTLLLIAFSTYILDAQILSLPSHCHCVGIINGTLAWWTTL